MTVQEVIDELQKIEDKTQRVYIDDFSMWDVFPVQIVRPVHEDDNLVHGGVVIAAHEQAV